jgi:formiminotetrahydrofolate cyclodeaminase
MVGEITMSKKKPEDKTPIERALAVLRPMRAKFVALIDDDAAAFERVMAAFRLAKESEEEKALRKAAVEKATIGAADVPLETARTALAALAAADELAETGAKSAISDIACGALCLETAARAAAYNILINVGGIEEEVERARLEQAMAEINNELTRLAKVREKAENRIS